MAEMEVSSMAAGTVQIWTPEEFGALANGVNDDGPAFNAASAAAAAGGGVIYAAKSNYAIATPIVIGASNVRLIGAGKGGWHDVPPLFQVGATNLTWIGANGGTMITIAAPSGGPRLVGCEVSGMALVGGLFPFTSAADCAILIKSLAWGKIDVHTAEFSNIHVDFQIAAGLTEDCNNEGNDITVLFRALNNPAVTTLQGAILRFGGTNGLGNTCMNRVHYIGGHYLHGKVIDFVDCDNNRIDFLDGYMVAGGQGTLMVFRCQRSAGGGFARQNVLYWVTEQTSGGKVIVEGLESPGAVGPSVQNQIVFWDYGEDAPNVQLGSGCSFWYGSNTQPIGKIFEAITPSTASGNGASVDSTRFGDVWGTVVFGAAGTLTIGVNDLGNTPVNGVQNVQITPRQPGTTYSVGGYGLDSFTLTVSGAGQFDWRAIVI